MMESEVIVEVTEFDNLRNEYLQQEAGGNDYISMLKALMTAEYKAGQGKMPLFRFVLSIPQEGEIRVSWDSYNCKNYLYGETFKVNEPYDDKLRRWWSQSCLLELKRLKDLEALQQEYSQTTKL